MNVSNKKLIYRIIFLPYLLSQIKKELKRSGSPSIKKNTPTLKGGTDILFHLVGDKGQTRYHGMVIHT